MNETGAGKRPLTLAVASGKGGTGKTTIAVNLAKMLGAGLQLFDCDVEEPNCHLFLNGASRGEQPFSVMVPQVDESLCNACGECGSICQYSAIVSFGTPPLFFPEMCHSCGGCVLVCRRRAICEIDRQVGVIETIQSGEITLHQGRLDVGVAMATPLIRAVKSRRENGVLAILDAPPGTSCPVVTTLFGADLVLLVTEPTPFGLNDLRLAVDMVRQLAIPFAVVINRVGIGDARVHDYCRQENIAVLMELPDDRRIAEVYSRGELLVESLPEYRQHFTALIKKILNKSTLTACLACEVAE
jgi:MinD superfamily P-loop ATPase